MSKKTLEELSPTELSGRTALVRVDYNVPLDTEGRVADDTRIRATLPTIRYLTEAGARVVLLAHLGRPKGRPDPSLSLRPTAERLGELLGQPVGFSTETVGEEARRRIADTPAGGVLILENTRFLPGETDNDPGLAEALGALGDVYVNDAFGAAHRAHASTAGVAAVIREDGGPAVAGFLMERELRFLGQALTDPERPFVAVIGGAKISGKIDVIDALIPRVDRLLIGGAMANTFFLAMGVEVGESLVEHDRVSVAGGVLRDGGERILLPVDCVVAHRIAEDADTRVVDRTEVGEDDLIADIGPATRALYAEVVRGAATVLWNGPMGVFEMAPFSEGTMVVARAAAEATDHGATTILGGGDSAAAAEAAGVTDRLTHVSTGGGASLEFLAGALLPGVEALSDSGGSQ
jgi:phosphoglycerate kinase